MRLLGSVSCNGGPLFEHALWNVNERVVDDLPRTNNSIEGWHHAFAKRVGVTRPTIRRLVVKIIKEQDQNELILEQLVAGIRPVPENKRYKIVNERLKNIVANIDVYNDHIAYLRAVAHNL